MNLEVAIKIAGLSLLFCMIRFAASTAPAQPSTRGQPFDMNKATGLAATRLLGDTRYQKATWKWAEEGPKGPCYRGQALSEYLRNKKSTGTNQLALDELFTLKQVITGAEPGIVTYQLPVSYDATTNMYFLPGGLSLIMDCDPEQPDRSLPTFQECRRAVNGDCVLSWNTAYERPGQHAMQAVLSASDGARQFEVRGPVKPYCSSNLCQFSEGYSLFSYRGGILHGSLPESNAVFNIEIKTLSGAHVKTLTGRTTNGEIDAHWDLSDEHGRECTNKFFDAFFQITLRDSGRSQTLRQGLSRWRD